MTRSRRSPTVVTCPECKQERVIKDRVRKVRRCRPCQLAARYDGSRVEQFWSKVEKTATCWNWQGATAGNQGYGTFVPMRRHKRVSAHRYAYELLVGPIPDGLEIDHLCRNRACVNPAHLEPVTRLENFRRGQSFAALNARKTHCPRGHAFTSENTYIFPGSGSRTCRICKREAGRKWMRANRGRTDKHRAREAVARALAAGRLVKLPCEVCGTTAVQAHHEDYARPLDVRWFCVPHHVEAHARTAMLADQDAGGYRLPKAS